MRRSRNSSSYTSQPLVRSPVVTVSPRVYRPLVRATFKPDLRLYEDRRTFHPSRQFRPAATFDYRKSRFLREFVSRFDLPDPMSSLRQGFMRPEKVILCVRRKIRREVLFAFKGTGRGSKSRRRRNEHSDIRC